MDFTTFLAGAALLAFWVHTLLIAAAGLGESMDLRRRYDLAFGTGLRRATIAAGAGEGGALATWRALQVGRANGAGPILFHDRSRGSVVHGGALRLEDGGALELSPDTPVEVWISAAAKRRAAACPEPGAFAAALPAASRAAGWERRVELPLRVGATIWVAPLQVGAAQGLRDAADADARGSGGSASADAMSGYLLADFDPRAWRARVAGLTVALVLGLLVVAGACTWLCLWPPVFGTVSKVGAFAAVVAFNLFQLFGKLHHDAVQPPHAATLDGSWGAPRAVAAGPDVSAAG